MTTRANNQALGPDQDPSTFDLWAGTRRYHRGPNRRVNSQPMGQVRVHYPAAEHPAEYDLEYNERAFDKEIVDGFDGSHAVTAEYPNMHARWPMASWDQPRRTHRSAPTGLWDEGTQLGVPTAAEAEGSAPGADRRSRGRAAQPLEF